MTAGTVVITGGILATVILLCIIAVLCYCRLQVSVGTSIAPGPPGLQEGLGGFVPPRAG